MLSMRVLIISDVHANLTALEAVLEDAGPSDAVWCLGDLVGYGPDPNECVDRVRSLPDLTCLIGNHDQAALGMIPLFRFNEDARFIAVWTSQVLTAENVDFLGSLPTHSVVDSFTLAHGSPRQPVWEYILDLRSADYNFEAFKTDYCLVGHSHLPLVFHRPHENGRVHLLPVPVGHAFPLTPRMILNPGSVGQPRDNDPRAAYALADLDAGTWEPRRVAYDVTGVQLRILEAGLPERQAIRLTTGW
jgi:diadenosine tetraphosphatase ApaH/serine/threonine PP2A family protein phosphatase